MVSHAQPIRNIVEMPGIFSRVKQASGPLYPFVFIFAGLLGFLSSARLIESFIFYDHLDSPLQLIPILVSGVRIDLMVLAYLFGLPFIFYLVVRLVSKPLARRLAWILIAWSLLVSLVLIFFEAVTPLYIFEYGVRPERKFFEYLNHPHEVFLMLAGMYGVQAVVLLAALVAMTPFLFRWISNSYRQTGEGSAAKYLVAIPILLVVMVGSARSSLDHRPINPSTVAFTDDALVNNLPLNSLYSVLQAAYRLKDEAIAGQVYGDLPADEVVARVRREFEKHRPAADRPVQVQESGAARKNLVIILEESLGARFVERLGGEALTPNLNKLADDGWWFTRMYATGMRPVRGIEAVVTGFLPTPGRSVVKLSNSQSNFFTLASLLRNYGYRSQFYYGGNAHFDNMKGFFLGNGFHRVVEEKDFVDPGYVGSWGASDEDVRVRIDADLRQNSAQPQLMVMLSTSHHSPFDFPVEGGDNYSEPVKTRINAVRYADQALGRFFGRARQAEYWANTIFLVVADHDLKVAEFIVKPDPEHLERNIRYFPVEEFHIPALILGGGVEPRRIDNLASQIDLPPTLLGLAGIDAETPMLGTDFTRAGKDHVGRAIMQFNTYQAYLDGESLVVLRPGLPPLMGRYVDGEFSQSSNDDLQDLAVSALAHARWSSDMYREGLYK